MEDCRSCIGAVGHRVREQGRGSRSSAGRRALGLRVCKGVGGEGYDPGRLMVVWSSIHGVFVSHVDHEYYACDDGCCRVCDPMWPNGALLTRSNHHGN